MKNVINRALVAKKKHILAALILLVTASLCAAEIPDSVRAAGNAEYRIERGLNFDITVGVGLGRYEFYQQKNASLHTSNSLSRPTWNAGVGINYYFLPWMGLGTGMQFSTYTNRSKITEPWEYTGIDYQGDIYTLTGTPNNLSEQQSMYMLEVPLTLRFRVIRRKVGFHGVAGVKLGMPIYNSYSMPSGGYVHYDVDYERWSLLIKDNIPGVIEDTYVSYATTKNRSMLQQFNYAGYAELGMLFRLQQRLDLMLALTATYYLNDVRNYSSNTPLGFNDQYFNSKYHTPYEAEYNGVLHTNEVRQLHPWSVALKVGLSINAGKTNARREYDKQQSEKRRAKRAEERAARERERERERQIRDSIRLAQAAIVIPDTISLLQDTAIMMPDTITQEPDTIADDSTHCKEIQTQILALLEECGLSVYDVFPTLHDTIYIHDADTLIQRDTTAVVEIVPEAALNEVLSTSVIWFKLDDTIPILEPEDILARIADILAQHPEQQIQVNGHACKLGRAMYNKKLALRRAQAVAQKLSELGVKNEQMIVQSLGTEIPFRYNGKHQLDKDRRVELIPVSMADSIQSDISLPTIEIVLAGSRLAQIARRYFNNPDYWVFIYEANRSKITNPDNLPANTELVIPNLDERLKGLTKDQINQIILDIKTSVR